MVNERKTENIVRQHFNKYLKEITIEEQSSDNLKIKKLLSSASKSGEGCGFPEFIIQYKNNPDFLIVVECKADLTKHESSLKDKFKDYSVDGVLLYSSYLSKYFDVLSIAFSGQDNKNIKISHFLQVKGEKIATPIFADELLSSEDYLNGYIKSPEKFRQDYEKLIDFSKALNDMLHHILQVKEDLRALLVSSILISLESESFKRSYKTYEKGKQLVRFLVQTCIDQFEKGNIKIFSDKKITSANIQSEVRPFGVFLI
jgi:hypothetical protein